MRVCARVRAAFHGRHRRSRWKPPAAGPDLEQINFRARSVDSAAAIMRRRRATRRATSSRAPAANDEKGFGGHSPVRDEGTKAMAADILYARGDEAQVARKTRLVAMTMYSERAGGGV